MPEIRVNEYFDTSVGVRMPNFSVSGRFAALLEVRDGKDSGSAIYFVGVSSLDFAIVFERGLALNLAICQIRIKG